MIIKYLPIIAFLLLSGVTHAQSIEEQVNQELTKIEFLIGSENSIFETAKIANRLIRLGSPAVKPLINVLTNSNANHTARWAAARVLGEIGDEQAIPFLISTMTTYNRNNDDLKSTCAYALALIGAASVQPLLNFISNQTNVTDATSYIALALGRLRVRAAEEPMIRIAESITESGSHCYGLESQFIEALGQVGSVKSISVLTRLQKILKLKESSSDAIQTIHSLSARTPPVREGKIFVYTFSGTCTKIDPDTTEERTIECPRY